MSRVRDSRNKSSERREDLVGGLGPDERLRLLVRDGEVRADGALKLAGAAVRAAPQLLFGERGEYLLNTALRCLMVEEGKSEEFARLLNAKKPSLLA